MNRVGDFNAFTIKYTGLVNRVTTDVGLSVPFAPTQIPNPQPPIHHTTALWDTGATKSVITESTASALNLTPTGRALVNHAGGSSEYNTYVVNVYLPNNVAIPGLMVSECPDPQVMGNFGAIIGMDLISQGDFSITNVSGQTWMSFRIPSITTIDYVVEANLLKYAGVGRNAPCPCGKKAENGRPVKFKHCHGKVK